MDAPATPLTVSELNRRARLALETLVPQLWVRGEIGNFTRAPSGHWYFTLKDDRAALKCVMWRTDAAHQTYIPGNGDAVLEHGRIDVYETGGQYRRNM